MNDETTTTTLNTDHYLKPLRADLRHARRKRWLRLWFWPAVAGVIGLASIVFVIVVLTISGTLG